MPITIGELTSRVNMVEGSSGGGDHHQLEELVKMVAKRLRETMQSGDDDGEIPERRSDS